MNDFFVNLILKKEATWLGDLVSFIYRPKMKASKGIAETKTSKTDMKPCNRKDYSSWAICHRTFLSLPASNVWKFNVRNSSVGDTWLTWKPVY